MISRKFVKPAVMLLLSIASFSAQAKESNNVAKVPSEKNSDDSALFPLYYTSGKQQHLLGSMIEWDDEGFRFRPFFSRYNNDIHILFPLINFKPDSKEGNVLNYYWRPGYNGLFPLFHHHPNDFSWYGPYWQGSKDALGFFPVAYHNPKGFSYYGPYWRLHNNGSNIQGLFPLSYHNPEGFSYFGPYWNSKKSGSFGFFPLMYQNPDGFSYHGLYWKNKGSQSAGVFPLFWKSKESWMLFNLYVNSQKKRWEFFPFAGSGKNINHFLLWFHNEQAQSNTLLPLYHFDRDGKDWSLLTPLAWWGKDKHGLSCINPFLTSTKNKESSTQALLMGLGYFNHQSKNSQTQAWLGPLLTLHKKKNYERWNSLIALADWTKTDKKSSWSTLAGLWAGSSSEDSSHLRLLPLLYSDKDQNKEMLLTPFWQSWQQDEDHYRQMIFPFYYKSQEDKQHSLTLFPLLHRSGDDKSSLTVTPFGGLHEDEQSRTLSLLGPMYISHEDAESDYQAFVWPLFSRGSNKSAKQSKWSILGGLWNSRRNNDSLRSLSLLPLMHYSKQGDKSTLITPFWQSYQEKDAGLQSAFPFFWKWQGSNSSGNALFPFYYYDQQGGNNYSFASLLWQQSQQGKTQSYSTWPFFSSKSKHNSSSSWLFPFYYRDSKESKTDSSSSFFSLPFSHSINKNNEMHNILGFLYHQRKNLINKDVSRSILWPLISHETTGKKSSFELFEGLLLDRTQVREGASPESNFDLLGGLLFKSSKKDGINKSSTLLELITHSRNKEGDRLSNFFPFFGLSHNMKSPLLGKEMFPLVYYGHSYNNEESQGGVRSILGPILGRHAWHEGEDSSSDSFISPLFHNSNKNDAGSTGHSRHALLWYDYNKQVSPESPVRGGSGLFPLWHSSYVDNKRETWLPLLLTHHESRKDYSSTRVAWYLYESETKEEQTTTEFIPFCRIDSGKKKNGFSFLGAGGRYLVSFSSKGNSLLWFKWGEK